MFAVLLLLCAMLLGSIGFCWLLEQPMSPAMARLPLWVPSAVMLLWTVTSIGLLLVPNGWANIVGLLMCAPVAVCALLLAYGTWSMWHADHF